MPNVSVSTQYKTPLNLVLDNNESQSFEFEVTISDVLNGITFYVDVITNGELRHINSIEYEMFKFVGDEGEMTMLFTVEITDEIRAEFAGSKQRSDIYVSYEADGITETGSVIIPNVRLLDHIYVPRIDVFNIERADDNEVSIDGENLIIDLKVGYDGSNGGIPALRLYYAQDSTINEFAEYIDLSESVEMLTTGVINDVSLVTQTFSNMYDWTFMLVFGDEYEKQVEIRKIDKSFANMHLSGKSTGGVCFGGFSKAEEGAPKLECYYPAYFYGGIAFGGNMDYSTTEQNTGVKWIDGKSVYRIVVEIPEVAKNNTSTSGIAFLPEGIDTIISINGAVYRGSNVYTLDFETNSSSAYKADFWIGLTDGKIAIRTNTSTEITRGYVIVEYTKTTD